MRTDILNRMLSMSMYRCAIEKRFVREENLWVDEWFAVHKNGGDIYIYG